MRNDYFWPLSLDLRKMMSYGSGGGSNVMCEDVTDEISFLSFEIEIISLV